MAGFTSQDDLINQVSTNGKFYRADWQKSTFATTAHTAGLWYSLFRGGGNPTSFSCRSPVAGTNGRWLAAPAVGPAPVQRW